MTSNILKINAKGLSVPAMDVADVVAWEKRIEAEGTPLLELMTRAGEAVAELANEMLGSLHDAHVVILAGSGNNGGDGWVAAQRLAEDGYAVTLVTRSLPEDIKAEPARTAALKAMEAGGFEVEVDPTEELQALVNEADFIMDAILGTGFAHSEVRAPYDAWIAAINAAHEAGTPVLAVDCPSGLNAQTSEGASSCVRADATLTMLAVKPGLITPSAGPYVGSLYLSDLGMPF